MKRLPVIIGALIVFAAALAVWVRLVRPGAKPGEGLEARHDLEYRPHARHVNQLRREVATFFANRHTINRRVLVQ